MRERASEHGLVEGDHVVGLPEQPALDRSQDARHGSACADRAVLLGGVRVDVVRPVDDPRARVHQPMDDGGDQRVRGAGERDDDILSRRNDQPHHGTCQEREVVGETMRGARLPQTRGPHPDDAGAFHRQPRLGCGRRRACRRTPQVRAAATDNGHLIAHRGPVLRQGRDEGTRRGDIGRIEEVDEGNAHRTSWFDQTCAAEEAVPAALARVPTVIRPKDACGRAR